MAPASMTLDDLLDRTVGLSFDDLDCSDAPVRDYLADLLLRFVRTDDFFPPGRTRPRLETIGDILAEIESCWTVGSPSFAPEREVALRRHLGDTALLNAGFFWERLRNAGTRRHYVRLGRWAYRFLAEHERAHDGPQQDVFTLLAERFELYAGILTYLREIYLEVG